MSTIWKGIEMNNNVIEMQDVFKIYPNGTVANRGVNFCVRAGEIHALVGENGAGKSTLMKMLFGLEEPTSGTIKINGQEVHFKSPKDAMAAGLGMVHQEFMLIPSFTVVENVALGNEVTRGLFCDRKTEEQKMRRIAEEFGLNLDLQSRVSQLPVGVKQRVEILKTLYNGAKVIILDEPTAVLTPQETEELFRSLKILVAKGHTIILITHKIQEVISISDRVTVLRDGSCIQTMNTADTNQEEISTLVVGRKLKPPVAREAYPEAKPVLRVENLTVANDRNPAAVKNLSLTVHSGEIFGIAGVDGNGQSDLIAALTGFAPLTAGKVYFEEQEISGIRTSALRKLSVGYIPEDRNTMGASLDSTIEENLVLNVHSQKDFSKGLLLDFKKLGAYSDQLIRDFEIKTDSGKLPVRSMSGGNIQKTVIARELSQEPKLIIACQPTRGVDIASIEYIHNKIIEQRNHGAAVLLISTELTEVMALSDRIGMMYSGELVATRDNDGTLDENEIGLYILGIKRQEPAAAPKEEVG